MPNDLIIFLFNFFTYTYVYIVADIIKLFPTFQIYLLIVLCN